MVSEKLFVMQQIMLGSGCRCSVRGVDYLCVFCRKHVDEYVTAISKLKVSDITGAVSKMMKSPPSVAALGDIANIPRYPEIERRFK